MKKFIFLFVILFSCQNDELLLTGEYEVTVSGTGPDCNLILIDFLEKDLPELQKLTGKEGQRYYAFNLDNQYNQDGLKLKVEVRKTADSEYYVCTTLGPAYPWVTVINAENLN